MLEEACKRALEGNVTSKPDIIISPMQFNWLYNEYKKIWLEEEKKKLTKETELGKLLYERFDEDQNKKSQDNK